MDGTQAAEPHHTKEKRQNSEVSQKTPQQTLRVLLGSPNVTAKSVLTRGGSTKGFINQLISFKKACSGLFMAISS